MSSFMLPSVVYHGTCKKFGTIDFSKCKPYKDFGVGFYLAYDYNHARSIALLRKSYMHSQYAYVYKYIVNQVELQNLYAQGKVLVFPNSPTVEWLHFIIACRHSAIKCHNYAIVIGPTADASTRDILLEYESYSLAMQSNPAVINETLNKLKVHRYGIQLCICTDEGKSVIYDTKSGYNARKDSIVYE